MRLHRLDLTRYGKFTNRVLDFGFAPVEGPDLTLIVGANEAGKSTAFDALLSLLFGIPNKTDFSFLHGNKAMEVGGQIDAGGRLIDLRRIKAMQNSLRAPSGEVLPQGVLGATLGGLTRDTYRSMFSLDEASLREGGEAILASQGELGAMLFAASSGLSEISAALSNVHREADALYRPRAHSTALREAIRRLEDLRQAQAAIDINATHFETLRTAVERTKHAHLAADAALGDLQRRLAEISRLRSALPLCVRYRADLVALAPISHWPVAPEGWAERANQLGLREAELASARHVRQQEVAAIEQQLAGLVADDAALLLAEALDSLSDLRARYRTAALDLPRRHAEQRGGAQDVTRELAALGLDAAHPPETLVLPAALTAQITELADAHAGVVAAARAARHEVEIAEDQAKALEGDDVSAPPAEDGALDALLLRMTHENAADARTRLTDKIAEGEARRAGILLSPFVGNAAKLALMAAPEVEAVRRRGRALDAALQAMVAAQDRAGAAQDRAKEATTRATALARIEGLVDDDEIAVLAVTREAGWQVHVAALDTDQRHVSAAQYHGAALAERVALTGNLARAGRLGEWRAEVRAAEAATREVISSGQALVAAEAAFAQVRGEIDMALVACGLPSGMHPDDFMRWLERRAAALELDAALAGQRAQLHARDERCRADEAYLAGQLAALGVATAPNARLSTLMDAGRAHLKALVAVRAAHQAGGRARDEAQRHLAARRTASASAEQTLAQWNLDWRTALGRCWIGVQAGVTSPSVTEIRAMLTILGRLRDAMAERSRIDRQIEAMQQDQVSLGAAVAALALRAGSCADASDPLATLAALDARVAKARDVVKARAALVAALEQARAAKSALDADAERLAVERQAMLDHFGVTTSDALRMALSESVAARGLRDAVAMGARDIPALVLVADMQDALTLLDACDADGLAAENETVMQRLPLVTAEAQALHADWREAQRAFDAVGADDRAARLAEERRTVLLEIEEIAMRYLRLRIGAVAVDAALKSYRDRHRSGMLEDASRRFRSITGGSFADLRTLSTDKGENLVAVRRDGGSLTAEDMSTGTRNQLFFALRMAGYMEFVSTREALPFVGDDVMETFDDRRSAATFEMLADVARHGQVIYLTHHDHLVDIARSVVGQGLRVLRLDGDAA